jgi:hypothetical protein
MVDDGAQERQLAFMSKTKFAFYWKFALNSGPKSKFAFFATKRKRKRRNDRKKRKREKERRKYS